MVIHHDYMLRRNISRNEIWDDAVLLLDSRFMGLGTDIINYGIRNPWKEGDLISWVGASVDNASEDTPDEFDFNINIGGVYVQQAAAHWKTRFPPGGVQDRTVVFFGAPDWQAPTIECYLFSQKNFHFWIRKSDGALQTQIYNNGTVDANTQLVNRQPVCVAVRLEGLTHQFWVDGELSQETVFGSIAGTEFFNGPVVWLNNSSETNGRNYQGIFGIAAMWNRALTDDELRQVTFDAWSRSYARNWQFPEGYQKYVEAVIPPDPTPDPGFGTYKRTFYSIPQRLSSLAPTHFGWDPVIRDINQAMGEELALVRAAIDKLIESPNPLLANDGWIQEHWKANRLPDNFRYNGYHVGRAFNVAKRTRPIGIRAMISALEDALSIYGELSFSENFGTHTITPELKNEYADNGGQFKIAIDGIKPVHLIRGAEALEGISPAMHRWRGRNDDGSESAATWKAAEVTPWTQNLDENFRFRFIIVDQEVGGFDDVAMPFEIALYWSIDGMDGWRPVTSDPESLVKPATSTHYTSPVDTTAQLTAPSFTNEFETPNNGLRDAGDSLGGAHWQVTFDDPESVAEYVEFEGCFQVDSQAAGVAVASGDRIWLKAVRRLIIPGIAATTDYMDRPLVSQQNHASSPSSISRTTSGIPMHGFFDIA